MSPPQQTSQLPEPAIPGGCRNQAALSFSSTDQPPEGKLAGESPDTSGNPPATSSGATSRNGVAPKPGEPPPGPQEDRCIEVCVGSSCFLKGAQEIIAQLQKLIEQHHLANLTLKGRFCMERCTEGVTVKVGEKIISGLRPADVPALFQTEILGAPAKASGVKGRG